MANKNTSGSTSAAFNNPFQHGLDKITHPPYGRGSGDIDFHSTKPYFTAPAIASEECDNYRLKNGNLYPKAMYDSLWNPVKGKVIPKRHKK
jgi:hypothetical protein